MNNSHREPASVQQRIVHEIRRLLAIFVYLAIFFFVFRLYTRLVLSEFRINYFEYGLTILKALVLAKVILTAEALRLGERFRQRPLIVPTLYATVVFSAFAVAFETLEHVVMGWFHGKSVSDVFGEILDHGWPHLAGMALVVFVAFLPFFAFREAEGVLGEGKLRDMFLRGRAPTQRPAPVEVG